jgi:hypothetical protein
MKLNVLERVTLMGLLPAEGSLVTFRILADLRKTLSFSEKEIKECGIVQKSVLNTVTGKEEGRIFWKKSIDKEITFGEQARIIINTALQKADKEEKVNEGNISLFEKFQPTLEVKK